MKVQIIQILSVTTITIFTVCFIGCKKEMNTASANEASLSANSHYDAKAYTITSNVQVPFELTVFVPCANGGVGDSVTFIGPLHIVTHMTVNGNNFSVKAHFQPQGIMGYGQTAGEKFQGTGVAQEHYKGSFLNGEFTDTFINNFRLIGQGSGNNYLVHQTGHITYNANGVVTAVVDNFSVECK